MSHARKAFSKHRKRPTKQPRKGQLVGYYQEVIRVRKRQDSIEDRLELVERNRIIEKLVKEVAELRERLDKLEGKSQPTSSIEKECEAIYEENKEELLKRHMGKIVAIDLTARAVAGIGKDMDEAYDNARKAKPEQDQFYFRRVGKPYVQRL